MNAASTCTELPARRASPACMCSETKRRTCAAHGRCDALISRGPDVSQAGLHGLWLPKKMKLSMFSASAS